MHDRVMRQAREAQARWGALGVGERVSILSGVREAIARDPDRVVEAIREDFRKPRLDALGGDVLVTLEQLRFCERQASKVLAARKLPGGGFLSPGCRFSESYSPYGVVLVLAPWNYPFQLSLVPAFSALCAGNAVILKPSERVPATARELRRVFAEARLPEGLVQVVEGGPEAARGLIESGPDKILLTGSASTGARVLELAASRLIPVDLELGGQDAAIVFSDANLERAAKGIAYGAYANCGQVCVAIKRILVERSAYSDLLERLKAELSRIGSDLGELARERELEVAAELVEDALDKGARVEGSVKPFGGSQGGAVVPILLSNVSADARIRTEECFGPVAWIERFDDENEVIDRVGSSVFGLGASVWSSDLPRARRVAERLAVGSCAINDVGRQIAHPAGSFGGVKRSGFGRQHGPDGLLSFSRKKLVMVNPSRSARERHWFPFSEKTYRQLSALIRLRHSSFASPVSSSGVGGWVGWTGRLRALARLVSAGALLIASGARTSEAAELRIRVTGLAPGGGTLSYLVFSGREGFPDRSARAERAGKSPLRAGETQALISVGGLEPGAYAVSVYQDEDSDGRLDKNWIGIPTEPVGASNNPKRRTGPPTFDEARFELAKAGGELAIEVVR